MKFKYLLMTGAIVLPMILACGGAGEAYCTSFATSFMESCQEECVKGDKVDTCATECFDNLEGMMEAQGCDMPAGLGPK
ncbi:MAG: hypothetical protein ACI9MC_001227 [Kiritimatiellia bacterium]|jgi:hypothetical protein